MNVQLHTCLAVLIALSPAVPTSVLAGAYVDTHQTLNPANSISLTGTVSVTPTFNNAQFNDKLLVGTVNNDQIKTPSTADPVSTVTGNNYHDETDLQIRGRNGLNYVFTRTYNSGPSATALDTGLGNGWVHSYGMSLVANDFGVCPNCSSAQAPENGNSKTSSISYTDERGGQQNFLVNETTYAVSNPLGSFDTLALDSPVAGQHTLTFRNGVQYIFQAPTGTIKTTPKVSARLIAIKNQWGDQLTLTYDTSNRLSTLTDNLNITGRTGLTFGYNGTDTHIQSITDWSLPVARKWTYSYTGTDLTGFTNPLNQAMSYTYAAGHLLHDVVKPLARSGTFVKTTFNYYQNGRVFNYHDALMNTETMDYDLYRKTTRVTDPRGFIREYNYDSNGFMTKLKEPDGGVLNFANQNDGLRNLKYDALGYATQYSYRVDKNTSATLASDTGGNVSSEQDALNNTIATTYSSYYDQVATVKDKRGNTLITSYYAATAGCALAGKPQAVTISTLNGAANVKLRDYCWNSNGTLNYQNEYLDAAGAHKRTTTYTYDATSSGLNVSDVNITATNTTAVIHTHYGYDNLGRKISETLYRTTSITNAALAALTTSYTFDALDRAIQVKNPEGRVQETVYDANGQVDHENTWYPSAVARAGCAAPATINGTSYVVCTEAVHQYDAADRRISTTDILGNISKFAYDPSGNLISQTDPNGHTTTFEYDGVNHKTAVIDANGRRTQTVYNQRGDVTLVTNPNGETVKSQYDAIGHLTQITDNLGYITKFKYDANGNQICTIDANEHSLTTDPSYQPLNADLCTVSNTYDELNRLTQSKDAQGNITANTYDLLNNRLKVTDANSHATTFVYDDFGRLSSTIDPLNGLNSTQSYINDEAGNVIRITDRKGQISQHFYDVLNRKTQSNALADTTTDTYTYNNYDDLVQVQNNAVTYTYAYDTKHRLQSKTDGRQNISLNWTFDLAGNIKTKADYQGNVTTYQYDDSNRMTAETNPNYLEVSYHYDSAGRLLDRLLSNGAATHYQYDAGGRLTRLTNQTITGSLVNDTQYTRDHIGNILTAIESTGTSQAAGTSTFAYDPEYRLLKATYPATTNNETIAYDFVGNRKTYTKGSLTLYYNVNAANRLIDTRTISNIGTVYESYGYDNNGSMTSISGNRTIGLTWDAHNRISQIKVGSNSANTFQYDPSGYRIQKNTGSTKNYYLQAEHLEAVYDNNNALLGQFFRGSVIDEVVNAYMPDSTGNLVNYTYHHDALESVLGQSGHDGGILSAQGYTSFGSTVNSTGSSNNMLKYTGREQDTETGFYYYRARYYDLIVGGRFLSEDPKGFGAGVNFYSYANNNPINGNDPTGMLFAGSFNAGESFGASAAQYWANQQVSTGNSLYAIPGALAALWAPATSDATLGILTAGYGAVGLANSAKNLVEWASNPLLYEVGQKTMPTAAYSAVANLPTIARGAQILQDNGWLKTLFNLSGPWGTTLATGPTPGASLFMLGAGSALATFGGSGGQSLNNAGASAAASGGFVLYPNKSNTNQMQSVYRK